MSGVVVAGKGETDFKFSGRYSQGEKNTCSRDSIKFYKIANYCNKIKNKMNRYFALLINKIVLNEASHKHFGNYLNIENKKKIFKLVNTNPLAAQ